MKTGGGSESTIIIDPSKSVLVYALHSLEYVLGLVRFQVFVPKLLLLYVIINDIFTLVLTKRPRVHLSTFTRSDLIEQRSAIKFCLRNEISAAETLRMLRKSFGNSAMSQKNVYKWCKDFKEGRERVDDLECSG